MVGEGDVCISLSLQQSPPSKPQVISLFPESQDASLEELGSHEVYPGVNGSTASSLTSYCDFPSHKEGVRLAASVGAIVTVGAGLGSALGSDVVGPKEGGCV